VFLLCTTNVLQISFVVLANGSVLLTGNGMQNISAVSLAYVFLFAFHFYVFCECNLVT